MRGLVAAVTAASLVLLVAAATSNTSVGAEGALFGVGGGDAGSDALVAAASSDEAYQEEVLQRCQSIWPKRYKHGYAHHSGPMMEEFFFRRWQKRRPVLPQIYLPVGWSTYFFSAARVEPFQPEEVARARAEVTALLDWLDKGRSYFSVQQFAGLLAAERPGVPCDLKLTMFVGGGPEDGAYAPHVTFVPIPLLSKVLAPLRKPRFDMVTFSGGFLFWQDPGGIRTDMRNMLQNETGFSIQERVAGWEALIQGSVFHLCPRGNGPTSYRLYESLQAGTIPIYIWEEAKWLAFEDMIDWESIALVVHRSDMASIPALVAATDAAAMRASILKSRSMWRYNYTSQYIVGRVQATAGDPATRAYRPNSTACVPSGGSQGSAAAAGPALQHDVAHALAETTLAVDGVLASAAASSSSDGSSGKPPSSEGTGGAASGGAGGGSSASALGRSSSSGKTAQALEQEAQEENYDVGSWDFVGSGVGRGGVSGFLSGLFRTVTVVAAALTCLILVRVARRRMRRSANRGAINRRLTY